MKVIGLNGRVYNWRLSCSKHAPRDNKSNTHVMARRLLHKLYPLDKILEEVALPGSSKLRLDFYMPRLKLAIEVQGKQHYQYVNHFHRSIRGFANAKKRDNKKMEWCQLNNISLVHLPYNEDEEQWTQRILGDEF